MMEGNLLSMQKNCKPKVLPPIVSLSPVPPVVPQTSRGQKPPSIRKFYPQQSAPSSSASACDRLSTSESLTAVPPSSTSFCESLPTYESLSEELEKIEKDIDDRIQEVFRALEDTPYHLLCPSVIADGHECTKVQSALSPDPLPFEVHEDAKAIVVICSLDRSNGIQNCVQLLKRLNKSGEPLPPAIVLLVSADFILREELVFEAMTAFEPLAAEIILQRCVGTKLQLDVRMAIETAYYKVQQFDTLFKRRVAAQERKFWLFAHLQYAGLPKMSSDLKKKQHDGKTILTLGERVFTSKLGSGGFGKVLLAVNTVTQENEAAKIIEKSRLTSLPAVDAIMSEFAIARSLTHPNIIKMKEVMHTSEHLILFMENAGNRNLYVHIASAKSLLPLEQVISFQADLLSAIEYCHSVKVAHLDIKPENLAVTRSGSDGSLVLKVLDFGCALKSRSSFSSVVGTMPFIAPEVLIYKSSCPFPADMWSCGVVMLEMLAGKGVLNDIMGWEGSVPPRARYGKHLVQQFSEPKDVERYIAKQRKLPKVVSNVLFGMLCPQVDARMKGEDAFRELVSSCQPFLGSSSMSQEPRFSTDEPCAFARAAI